MAATSGVKVQFDATERGFVRPASVKPREQCEIAGYETHSKTNLVGGGMLTPPHGATLPELESDQVCEHWEGGHG